MNHYNFKVNMTVEEAANYLIREVPYEMIYEKELKPDGELISYIFIFEKYFLRMGTRAALTVVIHNFKGYTEIDSVAAGSSQSIFFRFDWGAGDEFASFINKMFSQYIVE